MKNIKIFIIMFLLFVSFHNNNLLFASNTFFEGLENLSKDIEFQIYSKQKNNGLNIFLLKFISLYNLDPKDFLHQFKNISSINDNDDSLTLKLKQLIFSENQKYIFEHYTSFYNLYISVNGEPSDVSLVYDSFVMRSLKNHISNLITQICQYICLIDKKQNLHLKTCGSDLFNELTLSPQDLNFLLNLEDIGDL